MIGGKLEATHVQTFEQFEAQPTCSQCGSNEIAVLPPLRVHGWCMECGTLTIAMRGGNFHIFVPKRMRPQS